MRLDDYPIPWTDLFPVKGRTMIQGNRVHAVQTDGLGQVQFEEGDYGLHEQRGWCGRPPGLDHAVDFSGHRVAEHDDLTITVDGQINAGGPLGTNGPMFSGRLVNGQWLAVGELPDERPPARNTSQVGDVFARSIRSKV
jgi:hypothetical protein